MNKTDRKNKINMEVKWPDHDKLFTIKDLFALNPTFVPITLRVRLDTEIKKHKTVSVIGYKNVGKGRPIMILAMNPISQKLVDDAYESGIQPPEERPVVSLIDVTTPISTSDNHPTEIPINSETIPTA